MSTHQQSASPQHARAHQVWQQGRQHAQRGEWDRAVNAFRKAMSLAPQDDLYALNAAQALAAAGRREEALASAQRAYQINPSSELARLMAARELMRQHAFSQAVDCLRALPADVPRSREYWEQLGLALQHGARHAEAVDAFMQALALQMDHGQNHYRLGYSFYEMHLKEEAAECFRTALLMGVGDDELHLRGMLAYAERENVRWGHAQVEIERIRELVDSLPDDAARLAAPFAHLPLESDPARQLKIARLYAQTFRRVQPLRLQRPLMAGRRVRVGYVSGDFYQHATSVLMAEMLEHRDTDRFEVFLYSHGKDDRSPMRRRVMRACDHFVEIGGLDDDRAAQLIRNDGIDVLIDLKGYTAGNRIGVFARRPAPVQVSFLGYPGSTGAPFIDYVIGDPTVTPLSHAAHFSEKIAQMPACYQPNDRQRPLPRPTTRMACGLPARTLVLCGFNQSYKISPEVLDVWCDLMNELPEAVLWLLDWHPQARPNLSQELHKRGIPDARVMWAPRRDLADHIDRLAQADIFLDTWPYNAHTTASDALWAGVPVVTFPGQTFASRVASSLVQAAGVPELACADVRAYREMVLALAHDPDRRQALRERLVAQRETAALFDSERFTRGFEDLLSRMIERQEAGLPPEHLPAA